MRPTEYLEVYIQVPVAGQSGALSWVNFTEGLVNTNIIRGFDDYQGPWIQPDTGQLVLTSRNNQLDPEFNSQIRNKRRIKLVRNHSNTQETIFIGRIGAIDVRYQPRDAAPIITLTAFDIIADLNKTVVTEAQSEAFYAYPPLNVNAQRVPSCAYLLQYMNANQVVDALELGTVNVEYNLNVIGNNPQNFIYYYNKIAYGKTYYDALSEHARGNNGFWFAARDGKLNYRWRKKPTSITPKIYFDSRENIAGATPYLDLTLVDGYDRVFNNLTIQSYDLVAAFPPIPPPASENFYEKIQTSIDIWGDQPLTVTAVGSAMNSLQDQENEQGWLYESGFPHREISQVTWRGDKDSTLATTTDIGDFVDIYYEYGTYVIDRQYQIVGVRHEINANDWTVTYQLRNWDFKVAAATVPIITSDITSTDNATPVQFTLNNYGEFFAQTWTFGDGTTSTAQNPTKTFATAGTYSVTCSGTNDFGQVGVSDPIVITVSLSAPVVSTTPLRALELNSTFTHGNVNGQYYVWADTTQFETKNDWGFHFATNPERRTTTNHVYPVGPFQITQRSTDTVLPGNKVTRSLRLEASNTTATTVREDALDLDLATFNTQTRSARYILVRRYSSQNTYKYQSSSVLNDTSDVVRIKNVRVLDSNQTNIALNKPVVAVGNNNGFAQSSTLSAGEFTTWDIGTQPYLITDGNDSSFARFTTNLGPYTVSAPKGAGWLLQPDHYFIIDLGSVMSFKQINVEFSNEEGFPIKEQTPTGIAGSRGNVGYQVFYSNALPAVNGFDATYHAEYKAYPFVFRNETFLNHYFPVDTCVASKLPIN
jgi:PKD repeat protein